MKKILTTILCFAAGVVIVFAQGNVQWYAGGTAVTTNTTPFATGYPSTTGAISGRTAVPTATGNQLFYDYVLLTATTTSASDYGNPAGPDWTVTDYFGAGVAYGTNFSLSGVAGGVSGSGNASGFSSSLAAGTTVEMMVVGWSATEGTWANVLADIEQFLATGSWAGGSSTAVNGFIGYSNVGVIDPTTSPATAALIFTAAGAANSKTILYNVVVPEPATFALVGLGGLSLLLFRRRQ